MSEKELIEICKRLIEEKIQLSQPGSWKQRDFDYLSGLIMEKTGARLSVSTLKRVWKDYDNRMPQLYTLNALAQLAGFENWSAFKQLYTILPAKSDQARAERKIRFKIWKGAYIIIPVLLIGALLMFYFKTPGEAFKEADVVFKSWKNVTTGVPNTVIFHYDISKLDFDSAFIQHSWDKRFRARVTKDNNYQTFIYYYPGYHTASLFINDKVVKTEKVNISTKGWQAMVDGVSPDSLPQYVSHEDIFKDGRLYVSKETLHKNRIPFEDKLFWVNYFNVGDFKEVYGENFILETRLKNNLGDGGLTCQYTQLSIICEQGRISIPFCNPGCVANIHLHISEVFKNGRKTDLSPFGIDLSTWRNIRIKTENKNVAVYVEGKKIAQVPFTRQLGQITGFHYQFYGCGAVEGLKLFDGKNNLCFEDEFDRQP